VKLQVVRVGKTSQPALAPLVSEYRKRLGAFIKVEEIELRADSSRDKRSPSKNLEPIYSPVPGEYLVLLDERGHMYDSQGFAQSLQKIIDDPRIKTLTFLVGPPYGFNEATRKVAMATWSLSELTVPSDLAWVILWEQLYRAMTILKGMPYHHD